MSYPGNKNINGLLQAIINRIPQYDTYRELCAGSAVVARNIYHGSATVFLYDVYNDQVQQLIDSTKSVKSGMVVVSLCPADVAVKSTVSGGGRIFNYYDPPYLGVSGLYKHEMSIEYHEKMLLLIRSMAEKQYFLISHYPHPLYNAYLSDWNSVDVKVCYHGHVKTERLWWNYAINDLPLQDTNFLGSDKTDRQRINRSIDNTIRKITTMPDHQRQKLLLQLSSSLSLRDLQCLQGGSAVVE